MTHTLTYGLTHLAIAVKNIENTLNFYKEAFGMEVMYHEKSFLQLTTPGCNDIIVFEEKEAPYGYTGGIAHFGFRLKEAAGINEIKEKLKKAGAIITDEGEFVPGSPYIFFKDPDGYEVEVWFEKMRSKRVIGKIGNR